MVKLKTNKSVASRFKVTATGKLKRARPGKRHLLEKKAPKRKRQLRGPALVCDTQLKTYKKMMCVN